MSTITLTIGAPFWFTRPWWPESGQERVCRVAGLVSSDGRVFGEEQSCDALVDASIAPLVVYLNQVGFATAFCCSGLEEDHREDKGLDEVPMSERAYLYFFDRMDDSTVRAPEELVPCLPATMEINPHSRGGRANRIAFKRKNLSNAARREAWTQLEANVRTTYPLPN